MKLSELSKLYCSFNVRIADDILNISCDTQTQQVRIGFSCQETPRTDAATVYVCVLCMYCMLGSTLKVGDNATVPTVNHSTAYRLLSVVYMITALLT